MKKIIKYIAIIFALVLTLTAFVGCNASSSSLQISASTYELNKSKVVKDYVPKDYESIEDYSAYARLRNFVVYEDEIENPLSQESEVGEYENETIYENTLDVKRVGEDVFITATFYNKYFYNTFSVINGRVVEKEYLTEETKFYQTGKDETGYYVIMKYKHDQLESGGSYMSSYNIYKYFSSKDEYESFVTKYLTYGVGDYDFDKVYYSNHYGFTSTDKGVECNATTCYWNQSSNYILKEINTYNAQHVTNGIYTQSNNLRINKNDMPTTETVSVVINVEYKSKYDLEKFDVSNFDEGFVSIDSVLNFSHSF